MFELVTLDQVKVGLNIDEDAGDSRLQQLIYGASAMVLRYLKKTAEDYSDSSGSMEITSDGAYETVPDDIQTATILLVGILYDGIETKDWEPNYLPAPVKNILYPLRDPTLA